MHLAKIYSKKKEKNIQWIYVNQLFDKDVFYTQIKFLNFIQRNKLQGFFPKSFDINVDKNTWSISVIDSNRKENRNPLYWKCISEIL